MTRLKLPPIRDLIDRAGIAGTNPEALIQRRLIAKALREYAVAADDLTTREQFRLCDLADEIDPDKESK